MTIVKGYKIKPGAKLIGVNLENADLSGLNLSGANLSKANLKGANLTNANLKNVTLFKTDLTNANLNNTILRDTVLTLTNLTNVSMGTPNILYFKGIKSGNITFEKGKPPILPPNYKLINGYIIGKSMNYTDANFTDMDLSNINLGNSNLKNANLSRAKLTNTNLKNVALNLVRSGNIIFEKGKPPILPTNYKLINGYIIGPSVNLNNADLKNMNLKNVDLSKANLKGANLTNVNLTNANLTNANLARANLVNANLTNANLTNANLLIANLVNANLVNANLTKANLLRANLVNANLTKVNLKNTELRYADLKGVKSGNIFFTRDAQPILPTNYTIRSKYIVGPYVNLENADLKNAILHDVNLSYANLKGVKSGNITFKKGRPPTLPTNYKLIRGYIIGPSVNLDNADLKNMNLENVDLSRANLSKANLKGANLRNSYLSNANLSRAKLTNTNLTNVALNLVRSGNIIFEKGKPPTLPTNYKLIRGYIIGPSVNLDNADFEYSNLESVNFTNTNLTKVNLYAAKSGKIIGNPHLPSNYQLIKGHFIGPNVDLSNADINLFNGVNLKDINLRNITLPPDFNLEGANLENAQLTGLLKDINLRNTNLKNAKLNGNRKNFEDKIKQIVKDSALILIFNSMFGSESTKDDAKKWLDYKLNKDEVQEYFTKNRPAYLTGADLKGADLTGANLKDADLIKVKSGNITFEKGNPPTLPTNYKLIKGFIIGPGVDLTDANLNGFDLTDMDLTGAILAGTNLENVDFSKVNLWKASFDNENPPILPTNYKIIKGYLIGPGTRLTNANLSNANLMNMDLTGAVITNSNLTGANLSKASLKDARLTNASLSEASLNGANLTSLTYLNGNFSGLNLNGATLTRAKLIGSNFKNAELDNANLKDVNLTNGNLMNASLIGANLTGAILSGVDIRGANMTDVIIEGKINLKGTIYNNNTIGLDKYKSRMDFGFNLLVTSEYKNRVIKYNFKINEELPSEVKIGFLFDGNNRNNISYPKIDWENQFITKHYSKEYINYILTFNKNIKEIEKKFEIKKNLRINNPFNLTMKIYSQKYNKVSKGKIMVFNNNDVSMNREMPFITTISKDLILSVVSQVFRENKDKKGKITYKFTLNENSKSEIKIKYAFKRISSAFNIMSLPDWTKSEDPYDTLTFNSEIQEIKKTFEIKENALITKDLELDIRIKQLEEKILYINQNKFDKPFDFSSKIPKYIPVKVENYLIRPGANLVRANLSGADLSGLDLTGANLFRAYLYKADLSGLDLTGANLSQADLDSSNLTGANLSKANLTNTILKKATYDKETIIPDKYKWKLLSMIYFFNLKIISEYKDKKVKYTFTLDQDPKSVVKIKYAFIRNTEISTAYNIMKDLPSDYQILTFDIGEKEKDAGPFLLKQNTIVTEDLKLDIRIKESKGKIMDINENKFQSYYDFSTTIPIENTISNGNTILIEVDKGNLNGINNNSQVFNNFTTYDNKIKVFYNFTAYKYNENSKKFDIKIINWDGSLDVSKKYIFARSDNASIHPFYISDVGYGQKNSNKIILRGEGSHVSGIKGNQKFILEFNNNFLPINNIYFYCTTHRIMKGKFKLFSNNWNFLTISPNNGSEPKKNIKFNLTLDKKVPVNQTVKLSYKTLDKQGTAKAGKDFQSTLGTIVFNQGEESKSVIVKVLDDKVYEETKTVKIRFTNTNKVLTNIDSSYNIFSVAKIFDNDNPNDEKYRLTVNNPVAVEGNILKYILNLNKNTLTDISINYAVFDNQTDLDSNRYKLPSSNIKIKKGQKQVILNIPIDKDGKYDNKNKKLVLQFTSKNLINNPRVTGTVTEGDPNPINAKYELDNIKNPTVTEGENLVFNLSLKSSPLSDILVNYSVVKSETTLTFKQYNLPYYKKNQYAVLFNKGKKNAALTVPTYSDGKYDNKNKKLVLQFTSFYFKNNYNPKVTGIVTEGDKNSNDEKYTLTVNKPVASEGKILKYILTLNKTALSDILINYNVVNGNNQTNLDSNRYKLPSKNIKIKKGQKQVILNIPIDKDGKYDNKNKKLVLQFTSKNLNNSPSAIGTVTEGDKNYIYNKLKMNIPEVTEGNTKMNFTLNLGEKARSKITINYKIVGGTAKAGKDYVSTKGQLIFNKGEQKSDFNITIKDDNDFEIEETIIVEFSGNNINTFRSEGMIQPDNDKDPNQAKPDLTISGTSYNHNNGELSIKLKNIGNRNIILNNNEQFNSLFEATTNSSNRKDGTPEIKIGNKTYYVSKNNIKYLDIKNQNFSTYFEKKDGININSSKNNKYKVTLGSVPSGSNYYPIVNNPGLKADDSIQFKIKASFKKNRTYIFMADYIKYDDVKESNESNNYFVFTPNKTIKEASSVPEISGYNKAIVNKDVFVSKSNNNFISLYLYHYPDESEQAIAIKDINPSDLKNNWLLVTKENDNFKQYKIVDYDESGSGDTTEIYSDGYYYNIGTNPKYTGKNTETIYWYKKK